MSATAADRFTRQLESWLRDIGDSDYGTTRQLEALTKLYGPALAKLRREAGLMPVPINGSRARGLKAGWFRVRLRDGSWGYLQRRTDDCLQAAIASCAQIPPFEVPDMRIDALRLAGKEPDEIERECEQKLSAWSRGFGVAIRVHATPPSSGRWVGIVPARGNFADHCLIVSGKRDCLFDTASLLGPDEASLADPADIDWAITIERT